MATKISELPTSTTADGTEQVPIVQTATTKKTTLAQIITDLLTPTGGAAKIGAVDGSGGTLWTTVAGFITKILSSAGASVVGFIQDGTGAVATTMQTKARESVSVDDFGAVGDGVTVDTAAVMTSQVNNGVYETVLGKTYNVRQTNVQRSAGLIGTQPTSKLINSANDERVVLYGDNGSARTEKVVVERLSTSQTGTQTTDNTSSIYLTGVDNSHVIGNHIVGVLGMSSQYGSITLGPYAGNPATENQPKRQNRGNIYAFNDIDAASMACEVFSSLQNKYIGNRAYRADGAAAATSHAYRFTGYPGMPCDGNASVGNTANGYNVGLSVQTSAHYNIFAGFSYSNITTNGISLNPNTSYASDHNGFNYYQGIVNTADNGFYGDNPEFNRIDLIARNCTTYGVFLDATANFGRKKNCLVDAVVETAAAAAAIETDFNIIRLTSATLTSNAVTISGNSNIVDVIVDGVANAAARFSLVISGNKNIVRFIGANNTSPATSDISVSGNDNHVTGIAATGLTNTGARNTFNGHLGVVVSLAGATDTILQGTITSITRGGTNTDYTGLRYGKGRGVINGTTTDANGDVTVTVSSIPTGLTVYNVTAQYISAAGTSRFVVLKSATVAANVLTMVFNFKTDAGANAAAESVSAFYQYEAY